MKLANNMKRKTSEDEESPSSSKRNEPSRSSTSIAGQVYRTPLCNGIYLTKVEGLSRDANRSAFSLFEIINKVNPIASIHFNFCIDPNFVISNYPKRCRGSSITLVCGQQHFSTLKAECSKFSNITVEAAVIPFPYGTHHSKLSIFESDDAIHVMISTANLIPDDYGLKTQCFYYCRGPFVNESSSSSKENSTNRSSHSFFIDDLIDYLENAYCARKLNSQVEYWVSRLRDGGADFSGVVDRIVASHPGRFTQSELVKWGHMRLRDLLKGKYSAAELAEMKTKIAQFSSIGSLGKHAQVWLCDEYLRSLCGGDTSNMNPNALKLIYPSVENVRCSLEGYYAGLSLPYLSSTHSKQTYINNFLYQWKFDDRKRTRAMPHVKSCTALDASNRPQWLLITSANLSQAAWGRLERSETQLFCRSYELGVLLCAKDHPDLNGGRLQAPFDIPPVKYGPADRPYMWDVIYAEPDGMGKHSAAEYREE